jgi:glycerol-3-phosphate acyltransferase PlsY
VEANLFQQQRTKKILATIIGLAALAAIAGWQFYMFVTFKDEKGIAMFKVEPSIYGSPLA